MKYFTIKSSLFLVSSTKNDEEYRKIDDFLQILEKSGVGNLINSIYIKEKFNERGRKSYNPFNMFAMICYCFSKYESTLREIEDLCTFDLRVIYIMEQQTPSYKVICEFINKYIVPYQFEIFTMITKTIINEYHIDISNQYLDGTKIEANANKYKFVWKPTTFHKRLDSKIKQHLSLLNTENLIDEKQLIKASELNKILNNFAIQNNIDINNIPSGKGIRLTKEQKFFKLGYNYLLKLLEYEEKEEICGENRNSYYKTDKDATAMMLKEDYYSKLSHDFHAAYNFQILVSSGLITMYGVYQDRADFYTFEPMVDTYYKYYNQYPTNICADSGYGIYSNYKYLKEKSIGNYVKFQAWKGERSGKSPQLFFTFDDGIMCLNSTIGEEQKFVRVHQRSKGAKLYKFTGCDKCNYVYKCKAKMKQENKDKEFRIVELVVDYELLKEQARQNLLSKEGIQIRINRSIQVEGTFGQIKNNMRYIRIRRRGIKKVSCEIMLMCLGRNIRKLFTFLDGKTIKSSFWNVPLNLKEEKVNYPKEKKTVRN